MGQISTAPSPPSIIFSPVDRLIASNADGGLSPLASHVVLFGENAGQNMGDVDYVYVIGADSLKGGEANVAHTGTVIYGAQNYSALTGQFASAVADGPSIVIGYNNLPNALYNVGSAILIGTNIYQGGPANTADMAAAVVIGVEAMQNQKLDQSGGYGAARSVVIGWRAMRGRTGGAAISGASVNDCIAIGAQCMEDAGSLITFGAVQLEGDIAIGTRAMISNGTTNGSNSVHNTGIGYETAQQTRNSQRCVWLGANINVASQGFDDVLIGSMIQGDHTAGQGGNVVVGGRSNIQGVGSSNVVIGSRANNSFQLGGNDNFLVETADFNTGANTRSVLYGKFSTGATDGGIIIGHSTSANRDLPGFNILKILTGVYSSVAPVGGGIFYFDAVTGLHFVGPSGIDTILAPP